MHIAGLTFLVTIFLGTPMTVSMKKMGLGWYRRFRVCCLTSNQGGGIYSDMGAVSDHIQRHLSSPRRFASQNFNSHRTPEESFLERYHAFSYDVMITTPILLWIGITMVIM
jgi:hypothetical protein